MTEIRCIGICTGGGDAPGLNAVIRAAVKSAIHKYNWKVIGIPDGFDGLIWPERSHQLTLKDVSGILSRGGSVANRVGDAISLCAHKEVRVSILGHIQRGGSPSPYDRVLATRFGVKAVDLIAENAFGKMVCLRGETVCAVDIADAVGRMKTVDPNGELVRTAR